jgi:hypothetical protein
MATANPKINRIKASDGFGRRRRAARRACNAVSRKFAFAARNGQSSRKIPDPAPDRNASRTRTIADPLLETTFGREHGGSVDVIILP